MNNYNKILQYRNSTFKMLFTHLVLATVATAAVIPRDTTTVIADLHTVNDDNGEVGGAVEQYNGGLLNALPIVDAANKLDNDINQATDDANASNSVSEGDAQTIIDYIHNTLEPGVATTVNAIKAKKPNFDQDGLSSTVHDQLVTLQADTDKLGAALVAKAPADLADKAKAEVKKIDNDFQDVINYFS